MSIDAEVAVVGAGPVGTTLAILLGQLGHTVVVAERWPEPYPLPRAVHLDHEVARIFQSCGIGPQLTALGEAARVYEWRNAAGATLLRIGRLEDSASGWPESLMFHQPTLEALLDERAARVPGVDIRRGVEVTGVDPTGEGAVVRTADGVDVAARYVVGCDGANSTVRRSADLDLVDLGYFSDWLIVDVILDRPRVFDPVNVQVCDPARPTTAVSGGPGRRRWEFMRLPHERPEELDDEARAWELLAPWDVHPGNARLERHALYTFGARYAAAWRRGPVLVAGDAAHQMPPFAGQGMCAGIRDAANLAWKLDLVLRGRAADPLLDTYEQERMPDARGAIQFSVELGRVICVPDPAEAAARDAAMTSTVGPDPIEVPDLPPIGPGVIHPDDPWAGHLFVQGLVDGQRFDDVHGAGWRLVGSDVGTLDLDGPTRTWFASIGGRIVARDAADPTGAKWFADHGCVAALQRPDFHLYGTATDAAGSVALLDSLRRRLSSDPPIRPGPRT